MRAALAALLLFVSAAAASAQDTRLDRVDIDEFGIYSGTTESAVPDPSAAAGKIERAEKLRLVASTRSVPAEKGVRFGFHFKVAGAPPGTVVPLRMVTIFPMGGLRNPAAAQPQRQNEYVLGVAIGAGGYGGYLMSEDWEVVPGIWTFQIWSGDRKMSEQHFMVMKK